MENAMPKATAVVFRDDDLRFWWASPTEEERGLIKDGGPLHMSFFQTHGGPFKTWQEADANAQWTLCAPGQDIEVQIVGGLPGRARQ
jgi:hypothetical protein